MYKRQQRRCAAKALARLERDAFGNLDQAARWYARALREDSAAAKPDCGVAIAAAECAVERGHDALARDLLGRAAKAHPKCASPWIALAKLDVARGDRDAAERCFAVALKAEPTHGAASLALGKCRHEVWRDAEGAKEAYRGGLSTLHRGRETSRAYAQWAPALWHAWAQVELAQDAHGRAATLLNLHGALAVHGALAAGAGSGRPTSTQRCRDHDRYALAPGDDDEHVALGHLEDALLRRPACAQPR